MQRFQVLLQNRLQVSGQVAYYIDYEDVLDLKVINGLAAFLGVDGRLNDLDLQVQEAEPRGAGRQGCQSRKKWSGAGQFDWFNLAHTPNYEPRRAGRWAAMWPVIRWGCCSSPSSPGRKQRMRKWMQEYGGLIDQF